MLLLKEKERATFHSLLRVLSRYWERVNFTYTLSFSLYIYNCTFYWYTLHFLNNWKFSWGGSFSNIHFIERGIQSYICLAKKIDVDLNKKYTYFFRFKQFERNSWSSFATRLCSNNNVSLVIFSLSNSTHDFTGRHPFCSEETVVPTDC